MGTALIGLLGVIIGSCLTLLKDWWLEHRNKKKELALTSIQVMSTLDRYVYTCIDVVRDDGLCAGQYDKDGCRRIQVPAPDYAIQSLDVEWKVLPIKLMYEVFEFSSLADSASSYVCAAFDYAASPPDYEEGFEERSYQYSKLGITAFLLSNEIRKVGGLPEKELNEDNPVDFFENEIKKNSRYSEKSQ
ncbi:MAG: hypothetical protein KUG72_06025 [Pseudomonadales bacterium]|nr:hypothetical protein [Pseudomonadales bacterium]